MRKKLKLERPVPLNYSKEEFIRRLVDNGKRRWDYLYLDAAFGKRWGWSNDQIPQYVGNDCLVDMTWFGNSIGEGKNFNCAWIGNGGQVIPCKFAHHDTVAEVFLGNSVTDVEKKFARVSIEMESAYEAIKYVDVNQVDYAMKRAILRFMSDHSVIYGSKDRSFLKKIVF